MKEALLEVLNLYSYKQRKKISSILVLVDGLKVIPKLEEFLELTDYSHKSRAESRKKR